MRLQKSPPRTVYRDRTKSITPVSSQALELPQREPCAEPVTYQQFSKSDSLLSQSDAETTFVNVDQETCSTPAPDPPPCSPQPERRRAPPQGMGYMYFHYCRT